MADPTGPATETTEPQRRWPMRPIHPWRYAMGFFGMSLPINLVNAQLAFFYVDTLGIGAATYASVMVAYFVIDLFDNPFYGWLSDRTRSRWGRRRPWIMVGAPLLGVSLMFLFNPPAVLGSGGLIVWLAIWAILTQTFDSLVSANYGAVLPEAFRDEKSRAVANSARQSLQLVAMVLSIGLSPMLRPVLGLAAIVLGTVAILMLLFMGRAVHEDVDVLPESQPSLIASLRAIVSYRTFWTIAIASGLYSGGMSLVVATVQFFVKYTLARESQDATYLLLAVIATSILCLILWTALVRRYGALPMWRVALGVLCASLTGLLFAGSLLTAIAVGLVVGLGYSGVMATLDLIVARLLDEDTERTGVHREGMFLTAFSFFNHTSGLMQALGFSLATIVFGYVSGDDPGPRAHDAARFLVAGFPLLLMLGAFAVSFAVRFHAPAAENS